MKVTLLKFSAALLAVCCLFSCSPKEPAEIVVESVKLSASSLELTVGDQKSLNATVSPANATNKKINWTSSRANVASVTSDGIVEGLSAGSAVITATSANGIKANCDIVVKEKVIPVTSVTLDKAEITLAEGDSQTLTATVKPDNATDKTITWTSSNEGVAKVDGGKVTAVSIGTATITAKAGDKTTTCKVTIEKRVVAVTSVTLDKTRITLIEGDTQTLTATVKPDDATDKTVTWTSSNEGVVKVDGGKVTAVAQGTATITAKAGDKTATCAVTVEKKVIPVTSVTLDKTKITLTEGDTQTLTATVKPDDATDKTITWTSSNESVATVDGGKVTAIVPGTATITAKAGDKTATCAVTVEKMVIPVASVTLDKTEVTLTVGGKQTLTATVLPEDATNKTVTWKSSNTGVAQVDGGVITAVGNGSATITAAAGDQSATCKVTVHPKGSYVDEFGINQGQGVTIDGITWAPVNCGFKEASGGSNGFIYGKLYQWGRKDGQGYGKPYYNSSDPFADESTPTIAVSPWTGKNEDADPNTYYSGRSEPFDWITTRGDYWNEGTESVPVKSEMYDPCPAGWRVPTIAELNTLSYGYHSDIVTVNGVLGIWYSGNTPNSESASKRVFLPAAGGRWADNYFHGSGAIGRGEGGSYWSSSSQNGYGWEMSLLGNTPANTTYKAFGKSIRCCKDEVVSVTPVSSLSISPESISIEVGGQKTLTVSIQPSNASYKAVFWTSDKESVAKIAPDGTVSALSEGQATITASVGDKSATCKVTVNKGSVAVTSVTLDRATLTMTEGETQTLTATVKPDNATDKTVTWTSSNTSVAKVDRGKVTAVAQGTATITAKAGDKTATCSVTVKQKVIPVTSITLDRVTLTMTEGDTQTLTAMVKPDDATDKTVTWTSSNTRIAKVDGGKVTAVAQGTATITAKAGDKTATCTVTVNQKVVDTNGPIIVSFDFTPKKVNVVDSNQKVTFTIHLTDETGVKPGFSITLYHPEYFLDTMQYVDFQLKSGDKKDGVYEAIATIAKGAPAGDWTVGLAGLEDELGYQTFLPTKVLQVVHSQGNTEIIVDNGGEHGWD